MADADATLLADDAGVDDVGGGDAGGGDAAGDGGGLTFGDAVNENLTIQNQVISENLNSSAKKKKSRGKTKDAYVRVDDEYEEDDDTAPNTSNGDDNTAGRAPTEAISDSDGNQSTSKLDENTPKVGSEESTEALIWEKTADEMVKSVVGMQNWGNTSVLSTAISATIFYSSADKANELAGHWLYFFVIFGLAYALCIFEHLTDDPNELVEELKVQIPERLKREAAMDLDNDGVITAEERRFAMKKLELESKGLEMDDEMKKEETRHRRGSSLFGKLANKTEAIESMQAAWKVCQMVEVEVNVFTEAGAELMIATLANICSLSLNTAMYETIQVIESGQSESLMLTTYAVFITYVACVYSVQSARRVEHLERQTYEKLEQTPYEEMKKILLQYAAKKKVHTLISTAFGFSIGYAWRQVFLHMETAVFGEGDGSSWHNWTFAIEVTLVTAFFNTIPLRYSMFLPKNESYSFQPGSKERDLLSNAWMTAIKLIVGLQWTAAIASSLDAWSGPSVTVALFWIAALVLMISSILLTQMWQRYQYTINAKVHGAVYAVFGMFDKLRDQSGIVGGKGRAILQGSAANDHRVQQERVGYTAVAAGVTSESHVEMVESKDDGQSNEDNNNNNNGIAEEEEYADESHRDSEQHIESDHEYGYKISFIEESSWTRDYTKAAVILLLGAMNVASGKMVYKATLASIGLAYKGFYDGTSNSDEKKKGSGEYLMGLWIACGISLFVWTCIVVYLANILQKAKQARRDAFKKIQAQMDAVESRFQKTISEIQGIGLR